MTDKTLREQTLTEAIKLTVGDRDVDYGSPKDNFSRIAEALNGLGYRAPDGKRLVESDVAIFQIVTKLARLVETPGKADSWVDVAGYAACGREVAAPPVDEPEKSVMKIHLAKKNYTYQCVYYPSNVGFGILKLTWSKETGLPPNDKALELALYHADRRELVILDPGYEYTLNQNNEAVYSYKVSRKSRGGTSA